MAIFDYNLPRILGGSPHLTASLNRAASSASLWISVAFATLLLVALSPYIEQRRWPFAWQLSAPPVPQQSGFTQQEVDAKIAAALEADNAKRPPAFPPTVVHDSPTQEQIAQAAKPLLADLTRQRDILQGKLNDALNAAKQPQGFQPFESGPILTRRLIPSEAQELTELLVQTTDIMRSVKQLPQIEDLLVAYPVRWQAGREFYTVLQRDGIVAAIDRLQNYQNAVSNFLKALDAKTQEKNGKYAGDLSRIIGKSNVETLKGSMSQYIDRLRAINAENDAHPLSALMMNMLLRDVVERARIEDSNFRLMWAGNFVAQRYEVARKEIEAYL